MKDEQEEEETAFNLEENPLKHYLDLEKPFPSIVTQLVTKLSKENSLLGNSFKNKLKTLQICLNCGHRNSNEEEIPVLALSNETDEFAKQLSVTLKIIYIYDGD